MRPVIADFRASCSILLVENFGQRADLTEILANARHYQCDRDNFSEVLEADPPHSMPDTSGLTLRFIDLRPE